VEARSAEVYRDIKHAGNYGLNASAFSFDLAGIVKRSRDVSDRLAKGVSFLLKKNKVTVFEGTGRLTGAGKLSVANGDEQTEITAKHIILATGARPLQLQGLEADGKLVWTYKEAMTPDVVPSRLLVVGAGAIGLEFASFYNELGAEVTVVEALPHILPAGD
jgi:dihydrolipoamide dehydrogenase